MISLPDISKWEIFNFDINKIISFLEFSNFFNENMIQKGFELSSLLNKSYDNDPYLEGYGFHKVIPKSYKKEELIKFFLSQIYNMDSLFAGCSSLKCLPDISKWDMKKTTSINYMFGGCTSLISLPDISNWNTQNISNMGGLFSNCSSLKSLPDISKWNINNVTNISNLFAG